MYLSRRADLAQNLNLKLKSLLTFNMYRVSLRLIKLRKFRFKIENKFITVLSTKATA